MTTRPALRRRVSGGGNYFLSPAEDVQFISSGSKTLDLALGGGWARNRVINIIGDRAVGKTLLCIEMAANFARAYPKGIIRYRESEHAFQKGYAHAVGAPIDRIDFGDPMDTVEELSRDLEAVIAGAKTQELYIVDSLDAFSDEYEMEQDIAKGGYGAAKAKVVSKMFRKVGRELSNLTLIIVSQLRDNVGGGMYGKKDKRSGGRALDYYASQVVMLRQRGLIEATQNKIKRNIGVQVYAKMDKNKVGLPFRECSFPILFGYGIDDMMSCVMFLKEIGSLRELNINEKQIKAFVEYYMQNDELYFPMEKTLHEIVERRWYEIEKGFLPTRRKYG